MINLEKLQDVKRRFEEVTLRISKPEVAIDPEQMAKLGPEHRELSDVVQAIAEYERMLKERDELKEMVRLEDDHEIVAMAKEELDEIEQALPTVEESLRLRLIPKDPEDTKDAIVEIRAGAGGDEAALFAGDLFRLYDRFVERRGWKIEVMNSSRRGSHMPVRFQGPVRSKLQSR